MDGEPVQTILVIDDDTSLLTVVGDFLRHEGYDVLTAENGEEGIQRLANTSPDLIILDISMPGMSGIQFLKELRARPDARELPVLVFTARSNTEAFFEGVDAAGFLAKPCEPARLLDEIRRILDGGDDEEPEDETGQPAPRVLLAEDDPDITDALTRVLAKAGYDVDTVTEGPNVLEKTVVWHPDVILLKMILPNMNGDRVAAVLQEMPSTRTIPIVLYEVGADQGSRHTRGETAIKRVLRNHDPARLLEAVAQLL